MIRKVFLAYYLACKGEQMKKKNTKSFLWFFSIFFFIICLAEGILYYDKKIDNVFLSIALNIQNAVKAFMLNSEIKINDAVALLEAGEPDLFHVYLTYMYVITIVLAPFCTVGALLILVKKPIYYIEGFLKNRKEKAVLIIGEGENKKSFVNSIKKRARVIVCENQDISEEKALQYIKDGIAYISDIANMGNDKLLKCFKRLRIDKLDYILLCDDNSLNNLFYLKVITEYLMQNKPEKNQVCYVQCREFGMKEVIQKFYDNLNSKPFDLNILDIKQKAVHKMLLEHKLYEYNRKDNSKDLHLAIVGFGEFGHNTLIQALNSGVFSGDSTICIDVYDKDMGKIIGMFLKRFSSDILDCLEENVTVGDVKANYVIRLPINENHSLQADGQVVIRFWSVDVGTIHFNKILNNCIADKMFTYAVIAVNDNKLMVATLLELHKLVDSRVPIVVRVNNEDQSFEFLNSVADYQNVHLINRSKDIYSLEAICNEDIVNMAKEFNKNYNEIEAGNNRKADEWLKILLFKRESAIAQAMHQEVKEWLHNEAKITDENFYAIMEHRRWCLFMISNGYKYREGLKDDTAKTNPCICTWEKLKRDKPDMLKHDYVPYKIITQGLKK